MSPSFVKPSPKSEGSMVCSLMTSPVLRSTSLTVDCPYMPACTGMLDREALQGVRPLAFAPLTHNGRGITGTQLAATVCQHLINSYAAQVILGSQHYISNKAEVHLEEQIVPCHKVSWIGLNTSDGAHLWIPRRHLLHPPCHNPGPG